jgi:hypothetical protein
MTGFFWEIRVVRPIFLEWRFLGKGGGCVDRFLWGVNDSITYLI